MALIIPATSSKPKKLIPADTHVAVLIHCIDLGVQEGGQYGPKRKLLMRFEIPGERVSYTDKNGVEQTAPADISEEYSFTLGTASKPSNLRKVIETLRGNRPITEQEAKSIDVSAFLGKVCLVGVIHKPSKSTGQVYANISGIMACPPKIAVGVEPEGAMVEYSPDAHDEDMWRLLKPWDRDKIENRVRPQAPVAPTPKPTGPMDHPPGEPFNDEIPFGNDERGFVSTTPAW